MNYQRVYNLIIENRKSNPIMGYVERHHIIPRSIGGSDASENIVKLSAREHFICHLLLTKIHKGLPSYYKMLRAFVMMLWCKRDYQERYVSSKTYENLRKEFAKAQSLKVGDKNSQFGTKWVINKITLESKKVSAKEELLSGWIPGRSINIKKDNENLLIKKLVKDLKITQLSEWYQIYNKVGFKEFVNQTGYTKSQANLVTRFSKNLPDFIPQNGKSRGINQV